MFHLFTHAFFKALLFLGAGSVITAMHHEQDMRAYGGLRKKMPFTFWMMIVGTLAITGVGIPFSADLFGIPIGFAGFDSKDAIIESVYAVGLDVRLLAAGDRRRLHRLLFLAADLHDLLRRGQGGHDKHAHARTTTIRPRPIERHDEPLPDRDDDGHGHGHHAAREPVGDDHAAAACWRSARRRRATSSPSSSSA